MKAIRSQNQMKQLTAVISMLLFLFLLCGSINAQESSSKTGNKNAMLFTLVSPETAEALSKTAPTLFEEGTLISFSFPRKEKVELSVYDQYGNEIAELVNDTRNPGTYTEYLNYSKMKSGVYYYRLSIGNDTDIKKIMLDK